MMYLRFQANASLLQHRKQRRDRLACFRSTPDASAQDKCTKYRPSTHYTVLSVTPSLREKSLANFHIITKSDRGINETHIIVVCTFVPPTSDASAAYPAPYLTSRTTGYSTFPSLFLLWPLHDCLRPRRLFILAA